MLLQSCLGLSVRAKESRIHVNYPALPEALPSVRIRNIKIGNATVDLGFERRTETVAIEILRRNGDVEIITTQ